MTMSFAPGDSVRARGREWVALPSLQDGDFGSPTSLGGENDTVILDPALELLPVEPARFDLPADAAATVQAKAALLADAMRLTLRRGAPLPLSRATRLRATNLPARTLADGPSLVRTAPVDRR